MHGVHQVPSVNSSAVDQIEKALQQKVEAVSNYSDNPTAALQKIFKGLDENGTGKISKEGFKQGIIKLNFNNVDREIEALFDRFDLDRSKYLTIDEFGSALFKKGDKKLRATSTIGKVREVLAQRAGGFQALQDIGRQYTIIDKNKDGKLTREEMGNGLELLLRGYGLQLTRAENERIFQSFDFDGDGTVSYDEFIRGVRGGMNESRLELVKLAFSTLDLNHDSVITAEEIAQKYDTQHHPKVLAGEWTEKQAVESFINAWDKEHAGKVTLDKFIEYYEWVSSTIDNDDYFELVIRNAFHISGGKGWAENTTCRRVLATLKDGSQKVLEIKNDANIRKNDNAGMIANLKEQGYDVVSISLTSSG